VPVADEIASDDIRHRRVIVDDDDPAWRVRVISHGAPAG